MIQMAKYYQIDVKTSMRKAQIRSMLVEYLVDTEVLPESALDSLESVVFQDSLITK